jgi:hypothetical protein
MRHALQGELQAGFAKVAKVQPLWAILLQAGPILRGLEEHWMPESGARSALGALASPRAG